MWRRFWKAFQSNRQPADRPRTTVWRLQSLFNNFRRILEQNNAAMEQMAAMERALGGEYIFDRTFLETSVHRLSSLVHHVVYNLNALTDNAHVVLYERFEQIGGTVNRVLAGKPGTVQPGPCIPLGAIDWDLESEVGLAVVCLAELGRRPGIRVADGFALTAAGCLALLEPSAQWPPEELQARLTAATDDLIRATGATLLAVSVAAVEELSPTPLPRATTASADVANTVVRLLRQTPGRQASTEPAAFPFSVLVQQAFAPVVTGQVVTAGTDISGLDVLLVLARTPGAPRATDRYLLRRAQPFDLVASEVAARPDDNVLPDGHRPTDRSDAGLRRGSALLTPVVAKALAQAAMPMERLLGGPCVVDWNLLPDATLVIGRVGGLERPAPADTEPDLAAILARARVCCRGGQTVQSGVAAGMVVHVDEESDPTGFPAGAIAVARTASPRLAPLLQRAGALLTEIGTATGHLGIVAREARVPSVFGMPDVSGRLPAGTLVTVDASAATVYDGILDALLHYGAAAGGELFPTDPEYRILRRILRLILPLNLVDPRAPDFSPRGCRSFHDILHYCHERAVDELAHLQQRRPGLAGLRTHRLQTGVPMEIGVLDIGGGLSADAGPRPGIAEVRCRPLAAFCEGLCQPRAWNREPAALSMGDIVSGLPQTMAALNAPAASSGGNLAIVSQDYLNLSMQMGYHFSVIDAYQGIDPQRSHLYFRYAGGFADIQRRTRRAGLIRDVLAVLDFSVSQKQDLVVGRLKPADPQSFQSAMVTLGALTAFTRQRDTAMTSDEDRQALFASFAAAFFPVPAAAAEASKR